MLGKPLKNFLKKLIAEMRILTAASFSCCGLLSGTVPRKNLRPNNKIIRFKYVGQIININNIFFTQNFGKEK